MKNEGMIGIVGSVVASILVAGCAHTSLKKYAAASATGTESQEFSKTEPDVRGDLMRSIPELKTVHFDYDSAYLQPEARTVLVSNAEWLKDHGDVRVQVAGNCDERGTVEYNLALGQRRATAVREYYTHMGVAGGRVATISYGKEKPVCRESNEGCWSKNRRAETWAASPSVAKSK